MDDFSSNSHYRERRERRRAARQQRSAMLLGAVGGALCVTLVLLMLWRAGSQQPVVAPTAAPLASTTAQAASAPSAASLAAVAPLVRTAPAVGAAEPVVAAPTAIAAPSLPADSFFDPQRFSYEPDFGPTEIQAFLDRQPGPLKEIRFQVGDRSQSFTEVLVGMSSLYSVNPKIMLTLLEQQGGLLSTERPSAGQLALAMGFSGEGGRRQGLFSQLRWAGVELRRSARDFVGATSLEFADGSTQPLQQVSLGRYAIARVLAFTTTPGQLDTKMAAFRETYTRLFGDPRTAPVDWPPPAAPFLRWPMEGPARITSFFDHDTPFLQENGSLVSYWGRTEQYLSYDGHTGWDYAQRPPDPVLAAADGLVIFAGNSDDGCGIARAVILDHGNGYRTLYWHLDSIAVESGQLVAGGIQIGVAGSTGCSTGPHLHFQLQYLGRDVDPYGWCSTTPDPWAASPVGGPSLWMWADSPDPCGGAPPGSIMVDNGGPGFASIGAWQQSSVGHGGGALYVSSVRGATGSAPYTLRPLAAENPAVAVWRPTLPVSGRYRVRVYVPYFLNGLEDATDMRYRVRYLGGEAEVSVDASVHANQWADLGTYEFDPAQFPQVSVSSLTDKPNLGIWADAVVWEPVE